MDAIERETELPLTVAICTYNRNVSLRRTLESVAALETPGCPWELIVVDNNSPDATRQTVESFQDRLRLRYVLESVQGLSQARNRAVAEARGAFVAFTDDDVLLHPRWLAALCGAIGRFPKADYFGGRIIPFWPGGAPGWFRPETLASLGGLIVSHDLGTDERYYRPEEALPIGASMAFRRELLSRVAPFRIDLGPNGEKRGAGDESDLIARARAAGAEGVYVGGALCEHCVESHRTTLRHAFEYGIQRGLTDVALEGTQVPPGKLGRAALYAARGVLQTLKRRGDRTRLCLRNAGIEIGRRRARRESSFPTTTANGAANA